MGHEFTIERLPDRKWVAVCSCRRWRSDPSVDRGDAIDAGDAHVVRGDAHLRALAAMKRGRTTLKAELLWYEEQAQDPINTEHEREMWAKLADELRPRAVGVVTDDQMELF